jgi:hypothetical protein
MGRLFLRSDFAACRGSWLAGRCPCCSADLDWWGRDPEPIAEGVMICGRCAENEHHADPEFIQMMLTSLLPGWEP